MNGLIPHSHDCACSVFIYFPSSLSGSLQRQQLPDQTLDYSKDAGQDNNSSSPPFSQIPHFLKEISSPEEECVCVCVFRLGAAGEGGGGGGGSSSWVMGLSDSSGCSSPSGWWEYSCLSASFFVLKCFLKRSGCGEMEGKCALWTKTISLHVHMKQLVSCSW